MGFNKVNDLKGVIEAYQNYEGRSLKRFELNLILDKFNYDKERLFKETNEFFMEPQPKGYSLDKEALDKLQAMIDETKEEPQEIDFNCTLKVVFLGLEPEDVDVAHGMLDDINERMDLIELSYLRQLNDDGDGSIEIVYAGVAEEKNSEVFEKDLLSFLEAEEIKAEMKCEHDIKAIDLTIEIR